MQPSRRSQPYRRGIGRPVTPALMAMMSGKPLYAANPADPLRELMREAAKRQRRRKRP